MKLPLDGNDWLFYIGLAALFAGLSLTHGIGCALTVVGSILAAVGLINSFILIWISKA